MFSLNRRLLLSTRISSRSFSSAAEEKATTSAVQPSRIQNLANIQHKVEKVSLSRGLAMNKFEKDFLIFPEYSDTDDVVNINGYTAALRASLEASVNSSKIEEEKALTTEIQQTLASNKIQSALIPADFEGLGMCRKDVCKIYEELGLDWNLFAHVSVAGVATHLLLLYGTEEQKRKYLPRIASGELRPAIANVEYNTSEGMVAEATKNIGVSSNITLAKVPVFSQTDANVAIVFATSKEPLTGTHSISCYIIDKSELKPTDTWTFTREQTMGLKGFDVGTLDINTTVGEENLLGDLRSGEEIKSEIVGGGISPLAATTIGYTKRVLSDLANFTNRSPSRVNNRQMMSSSASTQRLIASLSLKLFSLESALYYVSGLLDEGVPTVLDVENALLLKMTRELLLETVRSSVEIFGLCSNQLDRQFEKNIRDVTAILGLFTEGDIVEQIAVATLSTWSTKKTTVTSTLKRLLFNEKIQADLKNPKLQHYIAEHAHPSLQMACQELEFSMSRVNAVIEKMVAEQGKNLTQDYGSLEGLARIFENHLAMVSVISRASRSYAVGLRNADLELAWATLIASRASRDNWFQLEALSDYFGLVKLNPSIVNAGRAVFDHNGYPMESPTERNW